MRLQVSAAAAVVLVLSIGCAESVKSSPSRSPQSRPGDSTPRLDLTRAQESLESRVTAYWNLRRTKDLGAMYGFYSSEYRSRVPRSQFLTLTRLVRFDIVDFHVVGAKPSGNRADVSLALTLAVPTISAQGLESRVSEVWVREGDGTWYKLDEPLVLPFPSR